MSLNSAMISGVTGLYVNGTAFGVTSSNITNTSTVGYKDSTSAFDTLLYSSSAASGGLGVNQTTEQNVISQGELDSTSNVTDLAISGKGFFVTSTDEAGTNLEYTRAGDFDTNKANELVNSAGLYLLGYAVTTNADGTTATSGQLNTVKLDKTSTAFQASSTIAASGELATSASTDTTARSQVSFYDTAGGTHALTITYTKTDSANEWSYSVAYSGDSGNVNSSTLDSGTVTFNSDGSLASVTSDYGTSTGGTTTFPIDWSTASGLSAQNLSIDFGTVGGTDGLAQNASTSSVTGKADGAATSTVSGYTIGTDGTVTANYSSGIAREIYKIPLATFANADGLTAVSKTAYKVSDASGKASVVTAGTSGAGEIKSKNLEASTADTATQILDLISTQKAYSSCAKIVSTSSAMMETLVNMGT